MKKRYLILAGILALTIAATGCGKKEDPKDNTQTPQATVAPAADDGAGGNLVNMQKSTGEDSDIKNVIGTKTDTASKLVLINKTGSEVSSIYIRPNSDDEDWGDELVQGMFTLKNGDKALYYYDKNLKDDDGKQVTNYDIRIAYTDEELSECFFRKIPLTTVTEISLLMDGKGEDAIPFAEYLTSTSKKKVSTLQEVKQRLGLTDDSSSDSGNDEDDDHDGDTSQPTQAPAATTAPEPTEAPGGEDPDPSDDPSKVAEGYIGKSLQELIAACGEPTGHDYQNEPETGETGYHYYDNFTVSTTVDESGNEVVAGVW